MPIAGPQETHDYRDYNHNLWVLGITQSLPPQKKWGGRGGGEREKRLNCRTSSSTLQGRTVL